MPVTRSPAQRAALGRGGEGRELQAAQAVLAPQGRDQLADPAALIGVAGAPVGGDGGVERGELLAVLVGQQRERAAAQAVLGAVPSRAGLAAFGDRPLRAGAVRARGGLLGGGAGDGYGGLR